jgi:hypothetical protein
VRPFELDLSLFVFHELKKIGVHSRYSWLTVSIHNAFVLEASVLSKIDQHTELHSSCFQVIDHLDAEFVIPFGRSLDFNDNLIVTDKVGDIH